MNEKRLSPTQWMFGRLRSSRKAERGQGLTEFALLVPLLVFVIAGVIDGGRILMVQHVLNDATRAAVRVAAFGGKTSSEVTQKVKQSLTDAGLDSSKAKITVQGVNASTGQLMVVEVDYPVAPMMFRMAGSPSMVMLNSSSSMPHE
jgi:Flp pilus assembly protein TadG